MASIEDLLRIATFNKPGIFTENPDKNMWDRISAMPNFSGALGTINQEATPQAKQPEFLVDPLSPNPVSVPNIDPLPDNTGMMQTPSYQSGLDGINNQVKDQYKLAETANQSESAKPQSGWDKFGSILKEMAPGFLLGYALSNPNQGIMYGSAAQAYQQAKQYEDQRKAAQQTAAEDKRRWDSETDFRQREFDAQQSQNAINNKWREYQDAVNQTNNDEKLILQQQIAENNAELTKAKADQLTGDQITQDDKDQIAEVLNNFSVTGQDGKVDPDRAYQKQVLQAQFETALALGSKKAVQNVINRMGQYAPKPLSQPVKANYEARTNLITQTTPLKVDLLKSQIALNGARRLKVVTSGGKSSISGYKPGQYSKLVESLYKADMLKKGGRWDSLNQAFVFPDGQKPPGLNDWASTNLDQDHYQAFVGDSGLVSQQPAVDQKTLDSDVQAIVVRYKGVGAAIKNIYAMPGATPDNPLITALVKRYNKNSGTNYSSQQYYDKFIKGKK